MTTSANWPFAMSVNSDIFTSPGDRTQQAFNQRYASRMTGDQIWEAMLQSKAKQDQLIVDNTPEALV